MSDTDNNLKTLYDHLHSYDNNALGLPEYESFERTLQNPEVRRDFYNQVHGYQDNIFGLPDYESFERSLFPDAAQAPTEPPTVEIPGDTPVPDDLSPEDTDVSTPFSEQRVGPSPERQMLEQAAHVLTAGAEPNEQILDRIELMEGTEEEKLKALASAYGLLERFEEIQYFAEPMGPDPDAPAEAGWGRTMRLMEKYDLPTSSPLFPEYATIADYHEVLSSDDPQVQEAIEILQEAVTDDAGRVRAVDPRTGRFYEAPGTAEARDRRREREGRDETLPQRRDERWARQTIGRKAHAIKLERSREAVLAKTQAELLATNPRINEIPEDFYGQVWGEDDALLLDISNQVFGERNDAAMEALSIYMYRNGITPEDLSGGREFTDDPSRPMPINEAIPSRIGGAVDYEELFRNAIQELGELQTEAEMVAAARLEVDDIGKQTDSAVKSLEGLGFVVTEEGIDVREDSELAEDKAKLDALVSGEKLDSEIEKEISQFHKDHAEYEAKVGNINEEYQSVLNQREQLLEEIGEGEPTPEQIEQYNNLVTQANQLEQQHAKLEPTRKKLKERQEKLSQATASDFEERARPLIERIVEIEQEAAKHLNALSEIHDKTEDIYGPLNRFRDVYREAVRSYPTPSWTSRMIARPFRAGFNHIRGSLAAVAAMRHAPGTEGFNRHMERYEELHETMMRELINPQTGEPWQGTFTGAIGLDAMLQQADPSDIFGEGEAVDAPSRRFRDYIPTFRESLGFLRDLGNWSVGTFMQQAPIFGSIMIGGTAGGAVGGKAGAVGGAFATGALMYGGDQFAEVYKQTGDEKAARRIAALTGTLAGGASIFVPLRLTAMMSGAMGKEYTKNSLRNALPRMVKEGAISGAFEFPAETLAQLAVIHGRELAGEEISDEQKLKELIEAGASGLAAAGGAGFVTKPFHAKGSFGDLVGGLYTIDEFVEVMNSKGFQKNLMESGLAHEAIALLEQINSDEARQVLTYIKGQLDKTKPLPVDNKVLNQFERDIKKAADRIKKMTPEQKLARLEELHNKASGVVYKDGRAQVEGLTSAEIAEFLGLSITNQNKIAEVYENFKRNKEAQEKLAKEAKKRAEVEDKEYIKAANKIVEDASKAHDEVLAGRADQEYRGKVRVRKEGEEYIVEKQEDGKWVPMHGDVSYYIKRFETHYAKDQDVVQVEMADAVTEHQESTEAHENTRMETSENEYGFTVLGLFELNRDHKVSVQGEEAVIKDDTKRQSIPLTHNELGQGQLRLYKNGQVAFIPDDGDTLRLGHIEEIFDNDLGDLGFEMPPNAEAMGEYRYTINGETYVNNYSDPTQAINRDADGNVVSVDLDRITLQGRYNSDDGLTQVFEKQTFTGAEAQELALQIILENNAEATNQRLDDIREQGVVERTDEPTETRRTEEAVEQSEPTTERTREPDTELTEAELEERRADIERRRQEELDNIGRKAVQKRIQKLRKATSEEKIAQAVFDIERNVKAGARITKEEQDFVNQKRQELKAKGVEIVDHTGKKHNVGYANVQVSIFKSLPKDKNLTQEEIDVLEVELRSIKRSRKRLKERGLSEQEIDNYIDDVIAIMTTDRPMLIKDGKVIQDAEVTALQIDVAQAEEILERSKKSPRDDIKAREDKIHAKYDAELAALEQAPESPTPADLTQTLQEVFDLSPEEAQNAAVVIDKLVEAMAERAGISKEEMHSRIDWQKGEPIEGVKAAVEIKNDGTAIIKALTNPDVTSPIHEVVHILEEYLTESERAQVMEDAGTEGWTEETSEYFAEAFETYLREGQAPNPELQSIFEKLAEWFRDIIQNMQVELTPQMKELFDAVLAEETQITEEAQDVTQELSSEQVRDVYTQINEIVDGAVKGKTRYQRDPSMTRLPVGVALATLATFNAAIELKSHRQQMRTVKDMQTYAKRSLKNLSWYQDLNTEGKRAAERQAEIMMRDPKGYMRRYKPADLTQVEATHDVMQQLHNNLNLLAGQAVGFRKGYKEGTRDHKKYLEEKRAEVKKSIEEVLTRMNVPPRTRKSVVKRVMEASTDVQFANLKAYLEDVLTKSDYANIAQTVVNNHNKLKKKAQSKKKSGKLSQPVVALIDNFLSLNPRKLPLGAMYQHIALYEAFMRAMDSTISEGFEPINIKRAQAKIDTLKRDSTRRRKEVIDRYMAVTIEHDDELYVKLDKGWAKVTDSGQRTSPDYQISDAVKSALEEKHAEHISTQKGEKDAKDKPTYLARAQEALALYRRTIGDKFTKVDGAELKDGVWHRDGKPVEDVAEIERLDNAYKEHFKEVLGDEFSGLTEAQLKTLNYLNAIVLDENVLKETTVTVSDLSEFIEKIEYLVDSGLFSGLLKLSAKLAGATATQTTARELRAEYNATMREKGLLDIFEADYNLSQWFSDLAKGKAGLTRPRRGEDGKPIDQGKTVLGNLESRGMSLDNMLKALGSYTEFAAKFSLASGIAEVRMSHALFSKRVNELHDDIFKKHRKVIKDDPTAHDLSSLTISSLVAYGLQTIPGKSTAESLKIRIDHILQDIRNKLSKGEAVSKKSKYGAHDTIQGELAHALFKEVFLRDEVTIGEETYTKKEGEWYDSQGNLVTNETKVTHKGELQDLLPLIMEEAKVKTPEELIQRFKDSNYKGAYKLWHYYTFEVHPKVKMELQSFDDAYHNQPESKWTEPYYSSITFKREHTLPKPDEWYIPDPSSPYHTGISDQAKKRQAYHELPQEDGKVMSIDYDFYYNQHRALFNNLYDAMVSPAWVKVISFFKSNAAKPASDSIFPSQEFKKRFELRLKAMQQAQRQWYRRQSGGIQLLESAVKRLRRASQFLGLAGGYMTVKQAANQTIAGVLGLAGLKGVNPRDVFKIWSKVLYQELAAHAASTQLVKLSPPMLRKKFGYDGTNKAAKEGQKSLLGLREALNRVFGYSTIFGRGAGTGAANYAGLGADLRQGKQLKSTHMQQMLSKSPTLVKAHRKFNDLRAAFERLTDKTTEIFFYSLVLGDTHISTRPVFLAAYVARLQELTGNRDLIDNIDWNKEADYIARGDQYRLEAIEFANIHTGFTQMPSVYHEAAPVVRYDPEQPWHNIVRDVLLPFNTYRISEWMRFWQDATAFFSGRRGTEAFTGMMSTLLGMASFQIVNIMGVSMVNQFLSSMLLEFLRKDMPEATEEELRNERRYQWQRVMTGIVASALTGGAGHMGEVLVSDFGVNAVWYFTRAGLNIVTPEEVREFTLPDYSEHHVDGQSTKRTYTWEEYVNNPSITQDRIDALLNDMEKGNIEYVRRPYFQWLASGDHTLLRRYGDTRWGTQGPVTVNRFFTEVTAVDRWGTYGVITDHFGRLVENAQTTLEILRDSEDDEIGDKRIADLTGQQQTALLVMYGLHALQFTVGLDKDFMQMIGMAERNLIGPDGFDLEGDHYRRKFNRRTNEFEWEVLKDGEYESIPNWLSDYVDEKFHNMRGKLE